jgi:hypothetical protein
MSLMRAIAGAYKKMIERNWDTVYWAVDLHGVCMKSNYETGKHEFIHQKAIDTLKLISSRPESKIILWSSVHESEKMPIMNLFAEHGIKVFGFNHNSREADTETGSFKEKFYFSVLLDDKAGFDPYCDWVNVYNFMLDPFEKIKFEF